MGMTKMERAEKYRREIADFEARQTMFDDFLEQGIWCAIGTLEEYLEAPEPGQPELPTRHKNKARAMVNRMKQWVEQVENDAERLYSKQEVVEGKLYDIVGDE